MSTGHTRRLAAMVMALGGALTIAACGGSADTDGSFTVVTPTIAAPGTTSFPAPPTSAQPNETRPVEVNMPVDDDTAVPTLPTRDDATVDARNYQADESTWFFRTPSGLTTCGFRLGLADYGVGCQTAGDPPMPEGPDCRPGAGPAIHITNSGVSRLCAYQGVYGGAFLGGDPVTGGMPVLDYGDTIIVQGASCISAETGVTCFDAGHSFRLSADESIIYS